VPTLYVTHQLGEAIVLAESVLVLDRGRVARQVAPLALLGEDTKLADASHDLENFLPGRVRAHDESGGVTRVALDGGGEMSVPLELARAPGAHVALVVRAEDVLVSTAAPQGLSARNVFAARVTTSARAGADVTLRCSLDGGTAMLARLTPSAMQALGIENGSRVWLAVKSHSLRVT